MEAAPERQPTPGIDPDIDPDIDTGTNPGRTTPSRRRLLAAAGALLGWGLAFGPKAQAAARLLTPAQTAGPFYPDELPLDHDNDLLQVGDGPLAEGVPSDVYGQVRDASGAAVAGVQVEIWQCDARGRYHHAGDTQAVAADPHFQGFGHTRTDTQGRYRFRTIRPVAYPGRAPHIHFRLHGAAIQPLTTQLYVQGEPGNAADGLFRHLQARGVESRVLADFAPSATNAGTRRARWDIVVART